MAVECWKCQKICKTAGGLSRHLSRSCQKQGNNEGKSDWLRVQSIAYGKQCIDREFLCIEYFEKQKSIIDIALELELPNHLVLYKIFKALSINLRSQSEAVTVSHPKRVRTNLKRFGKVNPLSRGAEPCKRKDATVFARYGVKNVSELESTKQAISRAQKEGGYAKRTAACFKRYGWTSPWQVPEIHAKARRNSIKAMNRKSVKANELIQELRDNGLKIQEEYQVCANDRMYYFDAQCGNVLIEFNGDYWHANPRKYRSEDVLPQPKGDVLRASQIWERDIAKWRAGTAAGFSILFVWELDWELDYVSELDRVLVACKKGGY